MQAIKRPDKGESFHKYDLNLQRRADATKSPMPHQVEALKKLGVWFGNKSAEPRGAILVLPTGGGKTFTAVRFLCQHPLSIGFKVLWLAHTHHLLEQAQASFKDSVREIGETKPELRVRVVSGANSHFKTPHIEGADDVVIASLQTVVSAFAPKLHPSIQKFFDDSHDRLIVVFDEAHHSPAPSYRRLLLQVREVCPEVMFLGLTATPIHSDERKAGWFLRLFPQGIIHQATAKQLMLARILSKPILEEAPTDFAPPPMSEQEYTRWINSNQDLPESVIKILAESKSRNEKIISHYAANQERYGKTIIFADRVVQCIAICEMLNRQNIPAGAVFSQVAKNDWGPNEEDQHKRSENAETLEKFKRGEILVLINVRMLTEGTDIPDIKTVFLTRQTTSQSLLVQMVGRGMRGPAVGGTENVYLVFFIDDWKQRIQWAEYDPFVNSTPEGDAPSSGKRPPLQLISVELIRRLTSQMGWDDGGGAAQFLSFLPCGWFNVEYDTAVVGSDEVDSVNRMVLVYDHDKKSFEKFIAAVQREKLNDFEGLILDTNGVSKRLADWEQRHFDASQNRIGADLSHDLMAITRHIAQNEHESPKFFPFEDRSKHDLEVLAAQTIERKLDRAETEKVLHQHFDNNDYFWKALFTRFEQFRSQFNVCVDRVIDRIDRKVAVLPPPPDSTPIPPRGPSQEVRDRVLLRDGNRCVCCGAEKFLQIDHVKSHHFGGGCEEDNLQTLCRVCNGLKGKRDIDFRKNATPLGEPPTMLPSFEIRDLLDGEDIALGRERLLRRWINFFYQCDAVVAIDAVHQDGRLRKTRLKLAAGVDKSWLEPHVHPAIRTINCEIASKDDATSSVGEPSDDGTSDDEQPILPPLDPDATVEEISMKVVFDQIFEVEGFAVRVLNFNGHRIKSNWARDVSPYPFQNRLNGEKTVEAWKNARFLSRYPMFDNSDYIVQVCSRDGSPVASQTKLRTVRQSYL